LLTNDSLMNEYSFQKMKLIDDKNMNIVDDDEYDK